MAFVLSPIWNGIRQFDDNGNVLANGTITTYAFGSSTVQQTTYDGLNGNPNSNPIELNVDGLPDVAIWLVPGVYYNFILRDVNGNLVDSVDGIIGTSAGNSASSNGILVANVQEADYTFVPGDVGLSVTTYDGAPKTWILPTGLPLYGVLTVTCSCNQSENAFVIEADGVSLYLNGTTDPVSSINVQGFSVNTLYQAAQDVWVAGGVGLSV